MSSKFRFISGNWFYFIFLEMVICCGIVSRGQEVCSGLGFKVRESYGGDAIGIAHKSQDNKLSRKGI